jgi:hypothetical protein
LARFSEIPSREKRDQPERIWTGLTGFYRIGGEEFL